MRLMSRAAMGLAATVLLAAPLQAQTSFSIAAGASVPTGEATNGPNGMQMGYNVTLGLGIKPPLAPLGLRLEGMFNSFGFKDVDDVSLRVMAGTLNGTISGPMLPMVYGIGGIGMYNSKLSTDGSESFTDMGFNIGAGMNFPLTGMSTFLEVRYHHVFNEGDAMQLIPITFGIKF
jgi:hypothetical protein